MVDRDRNRAVITLKELSRSKNLEFKCWFDKKLDELPNETKTYEAVGKMFILTPQDVLKERLKEEINRCEEAKKTYSVRN